MLLNKIAGTTIFIKGVICAATLPLHQTGYCSTTKLFAYVSEF